MKAEKMDDNFEDIFQDILDDVNEEDDPGNRTIVKLGEIDDSLFTPRSVMVMREELLKKNSGADVDHLTEFDVLMSDMNGCHADRMNTILGNMNNTNFVINYQRLLNYVKPKLKAIDIETHEPKELTQINVTVINSKEELNETKTISE